MSARVTQPMVRIQCLEIVRELGAQQVGTKAYLLWESNGRPEGGDFSNQARQELEEQLRAGKSLEEVERSLNEVKPNPFTLTHS